jgi:microcystin-dependent protein
MKNNRSMRRLGLRAAAAAAVAASCAQPVQACTPDDYLSTICTMANTYAPQNMMQAAGQQLSVRAYTALFALLGINFGGDGVNTFNIPDLRGRVIVGVGQQPGGTLYTLGKFGGTESTVLTAAQLPAHVHPFVPGATVSVTGTTVTFNNFPFSASGANLVLKATAGLGGSTTPGPNTGTLAQATGPTAKIYNGDVPSVPMTTGSISGTVNGTLNGAVPVTFAGGATISGGTGPNAGPPSFAVPTMPPYMALNYYIVVQGLYPPHP